MNDVRSRAVFPDGRPEWAEGMYALRALRGDDEGKWLSVIPLIGGRARLCVCTPDDASIEHWCYSTPRDAIIAWLAYPTVQPVGWNRWQDRNNVLRWPQPDGSLLTAEELDAKHGASVD